MPPKPASKRSTSTGQGKNAKRSKTSTSQHQAPTASATTPGDPLDQMAERLLERLEGKLTEKMTALIDARLAQAPPSTVTSTGLTPPQANMAPPPTLSLASITPLVPPTPGPTSSQEPPPPTASTPATQENTVGQAPTVFPSTSSGTSNSHTSDLSQIPYSISNRVSFSLPLDVKVPKKLREKIVSREFVNFHDLLDPSQVESPPLAFQKMNDGRYLLKEQITKASFKQSVRTIAEWDTAFAIYATVYITAFPQETAAMLKYGERVKSIARKGGDWSHYDVNFRCQRQFENMAWDYFHGELYGEAMLGKPPGFGAFQFRRPRNNTTNSSAKQGTCRAFNSNGTRCSYGPSCIFKHQCNNCEGPHPGYRCSKKATASVAAGAGPTTPPAANGNPPTHPGKPHPPSSSAPRVRPSN